MPIARFLKLPEFTPNMQEWDSLVKRILAPQNEVSIAFVGKYLNLKESYKSLIEALVHAGANLDTKVNIQWIDSEELENNPEIIQQLKYVNGILVHGGFGERGIKGKMKAI